MSSQSVVLIYKSTIILSPFHPSIKIKYFYKKDMNGIPKGVVVAIVTVFLSIIMMIILKITTIVS